MHIGIIGGGLMGLFSAYYLSEKGYKVTVIDQKSELLSASYGNAGMICPSHFVPLASPGIIKQSLKWMFDSSSPLYFRPSLNADFIQWCLAFWRNANASNVQQNMGYLSGLLNWSKSLYLDLETKKIIPPIEKKGIVMYCKTQHGIHEEIDLSKTAAKLGIKTTILSNPEMMELNPGVDCKGIGGVHYVGDMHTQPHRMMDHLKSYLSARGVLFINETAADFVVQAGTVQSIVTDKQVININGVILCNGVWSPSLAKN